MDGEIRQKDRRQRPWRAAEADGVAICFKLDQKVVQFVRVGTAFQIRKLAQAARHGFIDFRTRDGVVHILTAAHGDDTFVR